MYLWEKFFRLRKFVRYLIFIVNILVAFALLTCYLAPRIDPRLFWPGSVMGLAYPALMILNGGFVVFWLFFRWRYSLVSLGLILAGIPVHTTFYQHPTQQAAPNSSSIKVLTYNVYHFYSYLEGRKKDASVLNFISEQKAQIICLQETKLQRKGELNPLKMKPLFPGIVHCQLAHQNPWGGPVTFSAFPIVYMGEMRFNDTQNLVIYSDIDTGKDTIRVYNCHLQSFGINDDEKTILDSISFQDHQLDEIRQVFRKLKKGYLRRAEQIDSLMKHIGECPYPVIVCGDFNDTPISYAYRQISKRLVDSFVESGSGISRTYKEKLPPVRIDYIFHSPHFRSSGYERHTVPYSDHYPVSVYLDRVFDKEPL